ncbi:magnesium transporter [Sulfuriroseicoccus oceanibius]|uniref:Magnesium transporter MgtE n=1 Tax=Sulfuriroseicoccus oceanibius TaxID=2707525 RepID=A0A6B3LAF3_9BACT|nr:magnesium transporter [Sulfuriroseicoccus oceanibius]QQL43830.1 magnesium transporter [Sulfuriroseicoccus oceanibius]
MPEELITNPFDRLEDALLRNDRADVLAALDNRHPADFAAWFADQDEETQAHVLKFLDNDWAAQLVEYLPDNEIEDTLLAFSEEKQRAVLTRLQDDDRVDALQELSESTQAKLVALLPARKRRVTRQLLEFPETSAGGRMTTAFATVDESMTVRQAVQELRETHLEKETLSRIYVTDTDGKLIGELRLRDLAFAKRGVLISEIVEPGTPSISAWADQEEAAQMISKYDIMALPVVDDEERIVGIITHDDAIEILEEESTEDIEKAAGISGEISDASYINTPIVTHYQRRVLWVLGLAFTGLLSGYVLMSFQEVLDNAFLLALYMPMIVAAGGNTGGQAATMVIRSLSLGELQSRSTLTVIFRELGVGLLVGTTVAIAMIVEILIFQPEAAADSQIGLPHFALTVGCSLLLQITSSTFIGAALPLVAKSLRLDPAVIASPAITTLVDVSGLLIYFTFARLFLGI